MKSQTQLMELTVSATTGVPTPSWRPASVLCLTGLRERNALTAIAPTSAHGAKSVLDFGKRGATSVSGTEQRNGYGFGSPAGVDAPRIDLATGLPPRSWPV